MKKIIIAAALIGFVSSSAFAKTEGSYVGLDILRASASNQYKINSAVVSNYRKFSDSAIGFGVNYRYAFNFDKVFVAPGVFFDKLGTEAKDQDGDTVSANHRYGAKIDVGYDITDDFSAYVTGGLANVNYEVNWKGTNRKKSGSQVGYLAGIGIGYKVMKNLLLNLEYNVQSVDFKTPNSRTKVDSDISVVKLGLAYNF